jgi:hypothetical protein
MRALTWSGALSGAITDCTWIFHAFNSGKNVAKTKHTVTRAHFIDYSRHTRRPRLLSAALDARRHMALRTTFANVERCAHSHTCTLQRARSCAPPRRRDMALARQVRHVYTICQIYRTALHAAVPTVLRALRRSLAEMRNVEGRLDIKLKTKHQQRLQSLRCNKHGCSAVCAEIVDGCWPGAEQATCAHQ